MFPTFRRWVKKITGKRSSGGRGTATRRTRLSLEGLESRALPSSTAFGFALDIAASSGSYVHVNALATDAAGNAYVTGGFTGTVNFDQNTSLTSTSTLGSPTITNSAFVAKYSASGALMWAKILGNSTTGTGAEGFGIAVDPSGNVYTTGSFQTGNFSESFGGTILSSDHDGGYVSKISASGAYVWTDAIAPSVGNSNASDAYAIAVDGSGNVYSTGRFYGTCDFSGGHGPAQNLVGVSSASAYVSELDTNGNFVLATAVATQQGGGSPPSASAEGHGIAVDGSGNIYSTGVFGGTPTFSGQNIAAATTGQTTANSLNAYVSKLNSSGASVWAKDLGSGGFTPLNGNFAQIGPAIAVDAQGNVYTTGSFWGTGDFSGNQNGSHNLTSTGFNSTSTNSYVSKLDTSGNFGFADVLASGSFASQANAIAVDSLGSVYTTGHWYGTGSFSGTGSGQTLSSDNGHDNAYVSKLDTTGSYVWADNLGHGATVIGNGIAVDGSGDVYTAGALGGTGDFSGNVDGTHMLAAATSNDGYVSRLTHLIQDSFPGNSLSSYWITKTGSFAVSSNHAVANSPGASVAVGNIALVNNIAQGDVTQTVTVNVATSGQMAALVARYQGPVGTGMYQAGIRNTSGTYTAEILKNVGGTWTALSIVTLTGFSGSGTIRFDAVGSSLRLYLNATLTAVAYDATYAVGSAGLRALQGSQYSNYLASPVVPAALPFADNFAFSLNGPISADLFTQLGSFMVSNGNAVAMGTGKNIAVLNADPTTNVSVSATVTNLPGGALAALVARYQGIADTNMYQAGVRNTAGAYTAEILKNVNGTWTQLTNIPIANPGGTFTLRFDAVGSALTLFVNGNQAAMVSDTSLVQGVAGVRLFQNVQLSSFGATAVPNSLAVPATLPFTDALTASTTGSLSPAWGVRQGSYSITGGNAVGGSVGANVAVLNNLAPLDTTESVTVTNLVAGQLAALVARYQGPGDAGLYQAGVRNTSGIYTAEIWKNVAGTWTNLASLNIGGNPGNIFTLRFDAVGSSLRLFVNGIVEAVATDATFALGSVGLRGFQGVEYSNYSAAAVTATALPFTDNFSSDPSGPLSSSWFTQTGSIAITGGNAAAMDSGKNVAVLNSDPIGNMSVSAMVSTLPTGDFAGLVARYQGIGDANMYQAGVRNTGGSYTAEIYVNVNGTWTALANVAIANPGSTFTMRFDVVGSSLTLFVNNVQATSATDNTFAAGVAGVRLFQNVALSSFGATAL